MKRIALRSIAAILIKSSLATLLRDLRFVSFFTCFIRKAKLTNDRVENIFAARYVAVYNFLGHDNDGYIAGGG